MDKLAKTYPVFCASLEHLKGTSYHLATFNNRLLFSGQENKVITEVQEEQPTEMEKDQNVQDFLR